jgi:hypothetical protein
MRIGFFMRDSGLFADFDCLNAMFRVQVVISKCVCPHEDTFLKQPFRARVKSS